jgi:Zn-dependent protease
MTFFRITPDRDRPNGWQILELAGVPFYIEASFLIFVGIIMMLQAEASRSLQLAGFVGFVIFFSLLAHEAGHAIVARLNGLRPVTVSLVAFGGYTRHPPTTHGRSLGIIAAGPIGSLLMALLGWMVPEVFPGLLRYDATAIICWLFWRLNLLWFIFNVLPIYPMDGGQLIFHVFSFFTREPRALLTVAYLSLGTCAVAGYWLWTHGYGGFITVILMIMFVQQNVQIIRSLNRF